MKPNLNIQVSEDTEICVVGDIHEHDIQFLKLIEKLEPNSKKIVVSVGDLKDKGFGHASFKKIFNKIQSLSQEGLCYFVNGNHELKYFRRAQRNNDWDDDFRWLARQPLALSFLWPNQRRLTVLHGGVLPSWTWNDIETNSYISAINKNMSGNKIAYIKEITPDTKEYIPLIWEKQDNGEEALVPKIKGGMAWHHFYEGQFGYIASGHNAQKDGIAKFYKNSCNLDSGVYCTGILSCQIFNKDGLGELITVSGEAARPDLSNFQQLD